MRTLPPFCCLPLAIPLRICKSKSKTSLHFSLTVEGVLINIFCFVRCSLFIFYFRCDTPQEQGVASNIGDRFSMKHGETAKQHTTLAFTEEMTHQVMRADPALKKAYDSHVRTNRMKKEVRESITVATQPG